MRQLKRAIFLLCLLAVSRLSSGDPSGEEVSAKLGGSFGFAYGILDLQLTSFFEFAGDATGSPLGNSQYSGSGAFSLNATCFSIVHSLLYWTRDSSHPAELGFHLHGQFCPDLLSLPGAVRIVGNGTWDLAFGNYHYTNFTGAGTWRFEGVGHPIVVADLPFAVGAAIVGNVTAFNLTGAISAPP